MRRSSFQNIRFGRLLARWLPIGLLVFVALTQLTLAHTKKLTPWKGGGFGMFSTIDGASNRKLSCEILDAEGQKRIVSLRASTRHPIKNFSKRVEREFRAIPSQKELERIAKLVMESELVPMPKLNRHFFVWLWHKGSDKKMKLPHGIEASTRIFRLKSYKDRRIPPDEILTPKAVRIAVWRLRFDTANSRFTWERITPVIERGDWS